jgi:hypothetical protein
MKYKTLKINILLLSVGLTAQAQQATTAAGGNASGSACNVSYSVGQIVYTTITGSTARLAQGVQQPYIPPVLEEESYSVNTSGGDASSASGSVAYSIGQVVYIMFPGSAGGSRAEGVQRPFEAYAPISALPIELISFNGECIDQNILLTWITATEVNNDYFSIERSIDGANWQLINDVDGAGNSTSHTNYSFIDIARYNDISYYRLKQTDFNGQSKYVEIIATPKCGEDMPELVVFPNPTNQALNVFYGGDKSQIISTSISNLLGEIVYHSDRYEEKIMVDNKPNGIYFLHVNLVSENIIKTFVIID